MKVAIGSDHAGFNLKREIFEYLKSKGCEVEDCGCYSEERADYSDYGHKVANSVLEGKVNFGILMCGSGNGISMSANRHKGIRAALSWNPEIAKLARQHNNANILVLPARFMSKDVAFECINVFLNEQFEGGRHQDRIDKIEL